MTPDNRTNDEKLEAILKQIREATKNENQRILVDFLLADLEVRAAFLAVVTEIFYEIPSILANIIEMLLKAEIERKRNG